MCVLDEIQEYVDNAEALFQWEIRLIIACLEECKEDLNGD